MTACSPRPRLSSAACLVLLLAAASWCGAGAQYVQLPYGQEGQGQQGQDDTVEEPPHSPDTLHLAGLFYEHEWQEIMAFKAAIERVNMDKVVLPDVKLVPVVEVLDSTDGFSLSKKLCKLTEQGVAAIFGPSRKENINIVTSISETLEIPHILTQTFTSRRPTKVSVNIAPDRKSISQAIVTLLQDDMGWDTFTVIYEDDEGLFRLQEVLKAHGPLDPPITMRRLGEDPDIRPLLKNIRNSSESRILLDVSADKLMDIFQQAKQVNMMGEYFSYLVTSLDAHTQDFTEMNEWGLSVSNVTGVRLVDPDSSVVQNALQDWLYSERLRGTTVTLAASEIKASSALINDAVHMLARSLHLLNQTTPSIFEEPLSCDGASTWQHGVRIVEFMKAQYSDPEYEAVGMTGPLSLSADESTDGSTSRSRSSTRGPTTRRARGTPRASTCSAPSRTWSAASGTCSPGGSSRSRPGCDVMYATKLKLVLSLLQGMPFLERKANWSEDMGNDGFRGYSIDLISAIAKELNFTFEFYLVADEAYGSRNRDGKWNGIIKDLMDRKADLGICDLTITYEREQAVDFTMPFMSLGISILHTKAKPQDPNLFSFLEPFSTEVWFYMAFAYLSVSVLLFFLARMTPYEWDNPHPCDPNPEELENTFDLINSLMFCMGSLLQQGCDFLPKFTPYEWENPSPNADEGFLEFSLNLANAIWHNVGSLMQQGSDIAPKAPSTRMVAGMWWFFTLIMISSYTANLAAFLTASQKTAQIESAKDLVQQTKIQYGCMKGGSTESFFSKSNYSDYQRMWDVMENAEPSVFVAKNTDGVERVMKSEGGYAFLMESVSIEYQAARKCELRQVGGLLDSKAYGVALPKNSPYRSLVSAAVLTLQETGRLAQLKDVWWHQLDDGTKCSSQESAGEVDSSGKLGIGNVGGVFLVLMYGCIAAFFMAIMEFVWNSRLVAIENKIGVGEALVKELKFAVRCSDSTKPVRYKDSSSSGSSSSSRSVHSSTRSSASGSARGSRASIARRAARASAPSAASP
ncbi:glutamate receptor ionotropic, kainate 2-like [Frankliniella occidentalis]|uniref:Glutamate receptor ionotropic, kainate 2-like n=1 Tax=Frankliniella occidentalis TaxID=133901 RepID=A0A9C6TWZ5_FRAOC|nr:glutamate receptor ionotropic, kainate 2-like [Frankliniella occidentalis]